jgi:aryl-alcohol dehydrogenase-like predicted oxidoreductase
MTDQSANSTTYDDASGAGEAPDNRQSRPKSVISSERIVAVAHRWMGLTFSVPAPGRHHNVIHAMADAGIPMAARSPAVQGFLTNRGRWVDRKEGAAIAIAGGQIPALRWPPDLYSEDLW